MRILVKYPSRERPGQFLDRLNRMLLLADHPEKLYFLFSFDQNDPSMFPMEKKLVEMNIWGAIHYGHSKSKVDAVNRDMELVDVDWDVLLLMSDDMVCEMKGWDSRILREIEGTTECLWFTDGYQKDICTMPIITRFNYERYGYIYHPHYRSVFCDNEQTEKAMEIGVMKFVDEVMFRHVHPANTEGYKGDQLHTRNEMAWSVDERTYKQRKANGFPK